MALIPGLVHPATSVFQQAFHLVEGQYIDKSFCRFSIRAMLHRRDYLVARLPSMAQRGVLTVMIFLGPNSKSRNSHEQAESRPWLDFQRTRNL